MSSIEFDPAPFIASAKKALKDNNNVAAHFSQCRDNMLRQAQEVIDLRENNQSVVPELAYSAIHNNKASNEDINQIRKRGCVIVRGVFKKSRYRTGTMNSASTLMTTGTTKKQKRKPASTITLVTLKTPRHRYSVCTGHVHR